LKALRYISFLFFLAMTLPLSGQMDVTTFGVQFKPIIPSRFFNSGVEEVSGAQYQLTKTPRLGYNFGMVIRRGFTDLFSLEVGINYTRRRFDLRVQDASESIDEELSFIYTAYEIPLQGLLYVQLGEEIWMNAAGGFSIDMYPSDLFSATSVRRDAVIYDIEQRTLRSNWVQIALIANYGFEWRTKEDGIFYLGASYHRPFNDMALTRVTYKIDNLPFVEEVSLNGSYLTLDLRYFFHEDPERRRKVRKGP
jgi:hypothetical protein